MPHRNTSLAIKQAIYQSHMIGTIQPVVFKTGIQDYSLAVNSTEFLYKLILFKYLMLQVT